MSLETAKLRARAIVAATLSHVTRDEVVCALLAEVSRGFEEEARKRESLLLLDEARPT